MAPAVFTHARHPGPREDEQGNFSGRSCKEKRYFLAVIAQLYDKKEKKPLCVCVCEITCLHMCVIWQHFISWEH